MTSIPMPAAASRGRFAGVAEALAGFALVALPASILVLLVLVPAAVSIVGTFLVTESGATHMSLAKYGAFFADGYSRNNLVYTLVLTAAAAATAIVVATGIAVYLRLANGRVAALVQTLALFPLFVPSIIISYAMIRFLGPHGALDIILQKLGFHGYVTPYLTPVGPYIAFIWESIPFPVLVISAAFAQISDDALEAARDLGAGWGRILAEILLPQAKRAILIGFTLTFLLTFGSYTIAALLGPAAPEMMAVFMLRTFGELARPEEAEVQAVIAFAVCAVLGALYVRLIAEDKK